MLCLSFGLSIVSLFWLVIMLHEYIVWLRGGQRALLRVAVIASCIAIQMNQWIHSDLRASRNAERIYCSSILFLLMLLTIYVTYLIVSEPFAAPERMPAGHANLRDTFCSRRRLDAGEKFREFLFEIVEIGQ